MGRFPWVVDGHCVSKLGSIAPDLRKCKSFVLLPLLVMCAVSRVAMGEHRFTIASSKSGGLPVQMETRPHANPKRRYAVSLHERVGALQWFFMKNLRLRGGQDEDVDNEIEELISQGEMIDHLDALMPIKSKSKKPKSKQKPPILSIWRQISGQATHAYDFPSADATPDPYDGWRSDRHILSVDPNTTFFQEEQMVPFCEQDRFHSHEAFDERYSKSLNVSVHGRDIEVTNDGKTATVRLETGDMITDHVVWHKKHEKVLNFRAIRTNMTNTNWTAPAGWHIPKDPEDVEGYRWLPPKTSYVTWGEPRRRGTSRWVVEVGCKEGPLYVGCLLPPHAATHARPTKLKTPAWFMSDQGFASQTGADGLQTLNHVVVGQTGLPCWPPYFHGRSLLWLSLDHERGTLQVTVNSLAPFALFRLPPGVVPFVALRMPGDGVSLLSVREAIEKTPVVLRNDVMARWSVRSAVLCDPERETEGLNAEEGEGDWVGEEYEFWPGGRLKEGETIEEEEAAAMALTEEDEAELEQIVLLTRQKMCVTEDP